MTNMVPDVAGRDLLAFTSKKQKIIGLSGYAGSGKNAFADCLRDRGFKSVAFADKLRIATEAFDPIVAFEPPWKFLGDWVPLRFCRAIRYSDVVERLGYSAAKAYAEVRRSLQRMGTEVGRQIICESLWVDLTLEAIQNEPDQDWVITDVRFPNEVQAIRDAGGVVALVRRPGFGPANEHASEVSVDSDGYRDFIVKNDRSLTDLDEVADFFLRTLEVPASLFAVEHPKLLDLRF